MADLLMLLGIAMGSIGFGVAAYALGRGLMHRKDCKTCFHSEKQHYWSLDDQYCLACNKEYRKCPKYKKN